MADLLSKVSASGLSAGVFLLWWPAHVASQDSEALLIRGVLWALAFEILLFGFRPLERAVGRAVRTREPGALAPRRIAPVLAIAAIAAAVPIAMLCGERAPIAAPARAAAPKVIVKREIVRREVVVRRVSHIVRVPMPAAASPAPAAAAAVAGPAAASRTVAAAKPATAATKKAAVSTNVVTSGTTSDTKADLPATTVTTSKPAPAVTAPQPTTTAPPATSATATSAATATATRPAGS
jgi:hypothetical protein